MRSWAWGPQGNRHRGHLLPPVGPHDLGGTTPQAAMGTEGDTVRSDKRGGSSPPVTLPDPPPGQEDRDTGRQDPQISRDTGAGMFPPPFSTKSTEDLACDTRGKPWGKTPMCSDDEHPFLENQYNSRGNGDHQVWGCSEVTVAQI